MSRPLGDQLGLRSSAGLSLVRFTGSPPPSCATQMSLLKIRKLPDLVRLIGQTLAVGRPGGVALDIERRGHLNWVSQLRHAGRAWPVAIGAQPEANCCDSEHGDGRDMARASWPGAASSALDRRPRTRRPNRRPASLPRGCVGGRSPTGIDRGGSLEAAIDQPRQHARHRWLQLVHRSRPVPQDRRDDRGGVAAVERPTARQHLVEDDAQREDIGACVDAFALRLLGRHVGRSPHRLAGTRRRLVGTSPTRSGSPSIPFARPKSSTLIRPSSPTMTFAGLRSRWAIPCWWATDTASTSGIAISKNLPSANPCRGRTRPASSLSPAPS